MTEEQLTNNTLYISESGEFSSLDPEAVDRWETLGLSKDELDAAERRLWECKGNISETTYTLTFLQGTEEKEMQINARYYSEALKELGKYYPNAVFVGGKT